MLFDSVNRECETRFERIMMFVIFLSLFILLEKNLVSFFVRFLISSPGNTKVIIDRQLENGEQIEAGDYLAVEITDCTSQVLKGRILKKTTLQEFHEDFGPNGVSHAEMVAT